MLGNPGLWDTVEKDVICGLGVVVVNGRVDVRIQEKSRSSDYFSQLLYKRCFLQQQSFVPSFLERGYVLEISSVREHQARSTAVAYRNKVQFREGKL